MAAPDQWARTVQSTLPWTSGSSLIAAVPSGGTLLSIRFGWGFNGDQPATANVAATTANIQVMGLVTTVGNGTEAVPNARSGSGNASWPAQRWVYWEARAPRISTFDSTSNLATFQDSPGPEFVGTRAMVSASGVPAGQTLNVWASWAAAFAWASGGNINLWYWASLLWRIP